LDYIVNFDSDILFIVYTRHVQPAARKTKFCGPRRPVNVKTIMIY